MRHSFNLIHPELKTSSIRLVVSHKAKKYAKATGLTIPTSLWNQKAKSLISKCKDVDVRDALMQIDSRLTDMERKVKTEKDVYAAITYALGKETPPPSSVSFWDYFKEWSERETPSKRFRGLAYNRLSDMMGTKEDWAEIDGDWYFRFLQKADELGYSPNYKSTLIAKLKTVMNEGLSRGFHTNTEFKKFFTAYKAADTIALTQDEVGALWNAELTGVRARARDCFIVGVYCAGRFQDYSRLSEDNIVDGKLRYVQRKTGQTVIIPLSPRIREVFARNGGACPKITEQEVGREIKKIAKDLGGSFLEVVEITKTRGNKTEVEKHPRWELLSCHTARRSGASILYKSGVPIRVCRFLTGHTTDSMFLNYVKVSKEEGAEILARSDFFK